MILNPLPLRSLESHFQISPRAENPPMPSHNNALDPIVNIEHLERALQLFHHRVRESIVLARAVQRQDDRGCGR